jgi:hypothetical protein
LVLGTYWKRLVIFYNFVGKISKKIGWHIIKWTTPLATKESLIIQLLRILKHETISWRIKIYNKIIPITNLGHQHTSKNAGHRCTKEYKTTSQIPQQCTWDYNWLQTTCVVCKNLQKFTKFQTTKYNVVNGIFSRLNQPSRNHKTFFFFVFWKHLLAQKMLLSFEKPSTIQIKNLLYFTLGRLALLP